MILNPRINTTILKPSGYNWRCQAMDPTNNWDAIMSVELCYIFLLTKYVYTLHSLPFVLSKRKSSLANYLLVHHALFPIIVWAIINFYPGGHVTFGGFINSTTHVGLFGFKFVVLYYPWIKKWRKLFHVTVHVSSWLFLWDFEVVNLNFKNTLKSDYFIFQKYVKK